MEEQLLRLSLQSFFCFCPSCFSHYYQGLSSSSMPKKSLFFEKILTCANGCVIISTYRYYKEKKE